MTSSSWFDRALLSVAPSFALSRLRAQSAGRAIMNYDAATSGRRGQSWRPSASDADGAAGKRSRLAQVSRDMVRNTPFATRGKAVIVANVIGDGIIPAVQGASQRVKARGLELIRAHLDTTAIDADGRCNLYGLQKLAFGAMVESGEALIRRRRRRAEDKLPLPFQLQLLESDHLDTAKYGRVGGTENYIREGIEYDALGRRIAYHLFRDHPGSSVSGRSFRNRLISDRVPASEVIHLYRQDRPGQMRGVTWFAPVALRLQDLADYQDAHLMRQKVAACFSAFRTSLEDDPNATDPDPRDIATKLAPGLIQRLTPGESIVFAEPPGVDGYADFSRGVAREVAAGLGITYEALTGDLSTVNFSSARMGRMEMDRNISDWQHLLAVPVMMDRLADWFLDAWEMTDGLPRRPRLAWTPPRRVLVDPTKELPAMGEAVRLGFQSRSSVIRSLGYDPETVTAEIAADNKEADRLGLGFDSDGRRPKSGGAGATRAEDRPITEIEDESETRER